MMFALKTSIKGDDKMEKVHRRNYKKPKKNILHKILKKIENNEKMQNLI